MATLFASVVLLLLRLPVTLGVMNYTNDQDYVPYPITTPSCLAGTDIWTETITITIPTLTWTQSFDNTTAFAPTDLSNHTQEPTVTVPANQTSHAHSISTVVVGAEGRLIFSPSTLNATIGTTILFNFLSLNHTLTQTEFSNPCHANGAFDTGFQQFNPANESGRFVVEYEVTSPEPQWFFCAQTSNASHCHSGMVFSLNPSGAQQDFLQNALATLTTPELTSACTTPTFSVGTGGHSTGLPSSTMPTTGNLSSIAVTPTAIVAQTTNGASTSTVHTFLLILAYFVSG
jgi:plastocyanin